MNERFAQKNKRFAHLFIFGERPEQITHCGSFLVSDLSDLLTSLIFVSDMSNSLKSLIKKEEMSELLMVFLNVQKMYNKI